ncbi:DUF1045 domain-containing protein [Devosia oryzisoli]|uniref:DUF1045 domain-containing protein n=1 Tax=Devosia oryzisoli TaxID=2774138 RepID=UPI0020BE6C8E|nr:DUF1045 domain-containing protein [Devosia oryzisoli]
MAERFALYFAPSVNSPLWDRACTWLGRDPASGELMDGMVAGIDRARLLNLTQSAQRYGFHATLKAPMALEPDRSLDALTGALATFAASRSKVELGRLVVAELGPFLALVPEAPSETLQDFAAQVVEEFEPFRAPLSLKDREARAAQALSPRQQELLDGYGYPYVFDEFRFHMTLTDALDDPDRREIKVAAETWFGPELAQPVELDRLVLFHEPDKGQPFRRLADFKLGGAA